MIGWVIGNSVDVGRLHAADTESLLSALPQLESDTTEQVNLCIEQLKQTDDLPKRVRYLSYLFSNAAIAEQRAAELYPLINQTLSELSSDQLPAMARVVAQYPSLHEPLVRQVQEPRNQDQVRLTLVRSVTDYPTARRFTEAIQSPRHKRYALEALVRKTPSLDGKLQHLSELTSLPNVDVWAYSNYYELRPFAAGFADAICESVVMNVPVERRPSILQHLGMMAIDTDEEAAARYFKVAWQEVASHPTPWEPATSLLRHDPAVQNREDWLVRFDQFVLPPLVEGKCAITPLADLIRFDMTLLIDRTERSCVHSARSIRKVFPHVIALAFRVKPKTVMDWIEDERRQMPRQASGEDSLKDRCVFEISEFAAVYVNVANDEHRVDLQRLCEAALTIESPELRLATLAALSAQLASLNLEVPLAVLTEGRRLLKADFCPTLQNMYFADLNRFHLLEVNRQAECLERWIVKLKEGTDASALEAGFTFSSEAEAVTTLIQQGRFSDGERLNWYERLARVAADHKEHRVQAEIAKVAVRTDPDWAIRTIWALLPADRGRSGKPARNIDWIPAPSDAAEAIQWLESGSFAPASELESRVKLIAALYRYLLVMPEEDRDPTRVAIAQRLSQLQFYDHALGVIETIESAHRRTEARFQWLASH